MGQQQTPSFKKKQCSMFRKRSRSRYYYLARGKLHQDHAGHPLMTHPKYVPRKVGMYYQIGDYFATCNVQFTEDVYIGKKNSWHQYTALWDSVRDWQVTACRYVNFDTLRKSRLGQKLVLYIFCLLKLHHYYQLVAVPC